MPKVSLVITCYNYGRFLRECVDSVLAQTYRDFEIIIVNDGSTDETEDVAEEIVRSRPHNDVNVLNISNVGFPESRNIGIRASRGEYIMPLDADDMLAPSYLEETVRLLDEKPHIAVAYTGITFFGDVNEYESTFDGAIETYSVKRLIRYNFMCGCNLFRRAAWERVGGYKTRNDGLDGFYDWEFWLAMAGVGLPAEGIDKKLYLYRRHGPSRMTIADKKRKAITRQIRLIHKYIAYPRLYGVHPYLARLAVLAKSYFLEPFTSYLYRKSPRYHDALARIVMGRDS